MEFYFPATINKIYGIKKKKIASRKNLNHFFLSLNVHICTTNEKSFLHILFSFIWNSFLLNTMSFHRIAENKRIEMTSFNIVMK